MASRHAHDHGSDTAAAASAERFLFDAVPLAVVYQDGEGRFLDVNPAAARLFGLTRDEPAGLRLDDVAVTQGLDGTPLPSHLRPSAQALRTGRPALGAVLRVTGTRAGEPRVLCVDAYPETRPGEPGPSRVLLCITDITDSWRAEAVETARLRLVGVAATGSTHDVLRATLDEAEALTGSRIGFYHFVEPDQEHLSLQAWSTNTTGTACTAEGDGRHYPVSEAGVWVDALHRREPVIHNDYAALPHRRGYPEGHTPLARELVVPVMRGDAVVALLGVGNKPSDYDAGDLAIVARLADVAWDLAQITVEASERRRLEARLEDSRQLESLGRLAGGVAHYLNNLLQPILGYSELVLDALPAGHEARGDLEEIGRAAGRAREVVAQLLAYARRQNLDLRPLRLNDVVRSLAGVLSITLDATITVAYELGAERDTVAADARHLEQVVLQLAANAADAMPGGGTLTIATAEACLDAKAAEALGGQSGGDFVSLTVRDTGCGMDVATARRMFEPFFTTKELGRGAGLGLATTYGVLKQHNALIDVDTTPGAGTALRIYFPAAAPAAAAAPVAAPPPKERGFETILVVEDQPQVLSMTCRMLTRLGYRTLPARGAAEALVAAEAEPIDLLLTDVVMPDVDGLSLYDQLAATRPGLAVVFMSGYSADLLDPSLLPPAECRLLTKPFSGAALAEAVRQALKGESAP